MRNRSQSKLGVFSQKNKNKNKNKIEKGNLYLIKYQFGRNDIWCAEDNHNYMNNIYEKEVLDSNFN